MRDPGPSFVGSTDKVIRTPHTIPFSSGRLKYEEKTNKLATIRKTIPMTPEILKFIIGEESIGDKVDEASANGMDKPDAIRSDAEIDILRKTWNERRPSAGWSRVSQIRQIIASKDDVDEATTEDSSQLRHPTYPSDEFSDDETEETEVEKPYYDIEGRARELMEQEEENEKFIQELNDNVDELASKYDEVKKKMDRDIKNLLKDLLRFDDEDQDDIKEDIEAIMKEEDLSSIDLDDDDDEEE